MSFLSILHSKSGHSIYLLVFVVLGTTVFAEIQGVIDACVKLSGMPDLTLSFVVSVIFYTR